jgi:hypothetical protein
MPSLIYVMVRRFDARAVTTWQFCDSNSHRFATWAWCLGHACNILYEIKEIQHIFHPRTSHPMVFARSFFRVQSMRTCIAPSVRHQRFARECVHLSYHRGMFFTAVLTWKSLTITGISRLVYTRHLYSNMHGFTRRHWPVWKPGSLTLMSQGMMTA